ncbi:MAG: serine/threonine protein kinase [Rhodobacteraceae bacterium]|nr:serine/threonine protein kinase [Paracoccaceae bacterium]
MSTDIPQSVGKYRIDGILGEGAMGVVYRGHDPHIDRVVAIKTLHTHLMDNSERASWLERFAREAKAAGRVLHGNLVTIFDYLEQDEQPYLVMELINSETLQDRIARRPLPNLQEFGSIMTQMLAGLDAIHAAGIVHRDVKPANALLLPDGRLKIADFGVARVESLGATNGGMIGTPDYMSPEQFMGYQADHRADIFAAGVIMFELLTGRKPFESNSLGELTQKVISGNFLQLAHIAPELPPALHQLSAATLVADPNNRIPNARAFANAIHAALRNIDQQVMRDTERTIVAMPAGAIAPQVLSQTLAQQMPKSVLSRVETLLTEQIGPIAKVLVRRVSNATTDTNQLIDQLAAEIGPEHRDQFRAAVRAHLGQTGSVVSTTIAGVLSPELLEALTKQLIPHIGPIAKVLIKKTAKTCATREELCQTLSGHIDDDKSRKEFLSTMA